MTAKEVEAVVDSLCPLCAAIPGDETGLIFGDPATEVTGIATTWTPSLDVLRRAAEKGLNFVLTHEIPFFPPVDTPWYDNRPLEQRVPNVRRQEFLEAHGMVICRCHSCWDPVRREGIADQAARQLGFEAEIWVGRYQRVYEIEPTSLEELALHARRAFSVPSVRVVGRLDQIISKVGVAYGGFGQSWNCLEELFEHDADCAILGEMIDYTARFAVDYGRALIETAHFATENPGMANFARLLAERIPGLPVEFLDCGGPWVFR
jgi:putative NIF3 family GTP cyclohydrolase 1 type 2